MVDIANLKEFLDEKVEKYNRPEFIESDRITSYNVCYTKLLRLVSSSDTPAS